MQSASSAERGSKAKGLSLFHSLEKWNLGLRTSYRLVWILCWGIPLHAWDIDNISKIAAAVGEVVEVDNDVEELRRLDRARVLIKTSRRPTIQHTVAVTINGAEHTIHLVEETCYNPCRYECLTGSMLGSSDEVTFVESNMASMAMSKYDSSVEGIPLIFLQADVDGEHIGRDRRIQRFDGQRNESGHVANNHQSLTISQNTAANGQKAAEETVVVGSQRKAQ